MRKHIIAILIVFLEDYPSLVCGSCCAIFLSSMILTIWMNPYKNRIGNIVKVVGEISLGAVWMIFLIEFIPF